MAVELRLSFDENDRVIATHEGGVLVETLGASALPRVAEKSNPFQASPWEMGRRLFEAMGGARLKRLLEADEERLLVLVTDEGAAEIPWEFAATPDGEFLAVLYEMIRLLPEAPQARPARQAPLNVIILAADPLVYETGAPHTGYKLNFEKELSAIRHTLKASDQMLSVRRTPPTRQELQRALRRGPALLHLSCHGNVVREKRDGVSQPQAVLSLEDQDGKMSLLRGDDLKRLPDQGILRLVVFSACHTASSALGASLGRALVEAGIPAAIGMQGPFPDQLSGDFAAALYDGLIAGERPGTALRQARWTLNEKEPGVVGLPVLYVARGGNEPLPQQVGRPDVAGMDLRRGVRLPPALEPRKLEGRESELHALAALFTTGHRVVTMVGTGGIGKTALATAFAGRFGWRFRGGVIGATLATSTTLSPEAFFQELLGYLIGEQVVAQLLSEWSQIDAADKTERLAQRLLHEARERETLVLIDNYESVLDVVKSRAEEGAAAQPEERANAERLHRGVALLATGGVSLLLTSRTQPAELAGEVLFPQRGTLGGVSEQAGAELFFQHSTRADRQKEAHQKLAREVAREMRGHPLAIMLLAGEWDASKEKDTETFLATWGDELAAARRPGMAEHHVTFTVAFERSFNRLDAEEQARLVALARFPGEFFAEGAAFVWQGALPEEEGDMDVVRAGLHRFVERSLLRVVGWYTGGDRAATFRLEPVIARALQHYSLPDSKREIVEQGYRAYAARLVDLAWPGAMYNSALARLVQEWLDELLAQASTMDSDIQASYCLDLAVLFRHFGRVQESLLLLQQAEASASTTTLARLEWERGNTQKLIGAVDAALLHYQHSLELQEQLGNASGKAATLHEMAGMYVTQGEVERAMEMYQQSLDLDEQIDNVQGKAATLHEMAGIYASQGEVARAMEMYQQSLDLKEQNTDLQGKGATLHNMGDLYARRGEVEQAMELYQQSLDLSEQIGDVRGQAATLHNMAALYDRRGEVERAMELYQQSLNVKEQIGNVQGQAATLSQMSNMLFGEGKWGEAERLLHESLRLEQQIGHEAGRAFKLVKLGQIAHAKGEHEIARTRYIEGLAIFEQLKMPEAEQVRQLIASLDGAVALTSLSPSALLVTFTRTARDSTKGKLPRGEVIAALQQGATQLELPEAHRAYLQALAAAFEETNQERLSDLAEIAQPLLSEMEDKSARIAFASALASFFDVSNDADHAVEFQERAIEASRRQGLDREKEQQLSVLLYNYSGYLARAGRLDEAVAALEEVVAIDERWGLEDITSDRAALEQMRQRRDGVAEAPDDIPPEMAEQLQQMMRQFEQMGESEREALVLAARRERIKQQAEQVVGVALQATRDGRLDDLLPQLAAAAAHYAEDEEPGSPYDQLAAFVRAVAARLRGNPALPVPPTYVERYAAFEEALGTRSAE